MPQLAPVSRVDGWEGVCLRVHPFQPFQPSSASMSRVKKLALFLSAFVTGLPAFAAESKGVSASAEALFQIGPLPVTNSMVTSWVVALVLIIVIRLAIKRPTLIPSRSQAVVE